MRNVGFSVLTLSLLALASPQSPTCAEEFRVETDVFLDQGPQPIVQTLTVFSDGVVYDFLLTGVEEITIFDRRRERLFLMDTQRKVKTELSFESILGFVAEMRAYLNDQQRELLLANESSAVSEENGWLIVGNPRVTYRVEGLEPQDRDAALQFQQFADWYARLNAMRQGNLPPFLRIQLNSEIATRGLIPKTIERTITQKQGLTESKQLLRSQHLTTWRLSQTDRRQIDRASTLLATYPAVSFRQYIQLPDAADRPDRAAR
jgi:hypothetical protein